MELGPIASTDLFLGSEQRPLQVQRVTLVNRGVQRVRGGEAVRIRIEGAGVTTPEPFVVTDIAEGEERVVDVPVHVDGTLPEGTRREAVVTVETPHGRVQRAAELTVAAPGWTMFMVPHFHYDPFWWNTQAGYLTEWDKLPAEAQKLRKPGQAAAFDLVQAHLDMARRDADYKFVLAEFDYLKPYWDAHPHHRQELRRLIDEGRIELVGGMYNEPNTNLTSLESTIRNIVHGVGLQRGVIGGEPRTGWMLDVFGHDPAVPSLLADAGLTSVAYARGPFHQWGPQMTTGDRDGMQFATETEWIGPDGRGLLACYFAHHYPAGWRMNEVDTYEEAEAEAYAQFQGLKRVAATRNVLLPVGYNHVAPGRWTTEIHRRWNERYLWPRFVCALPREFFARVEAEAERREIVFTPQSRDMNPVYPGKDVSYIDIKQGQRAAETVLSDAEKLAALTTVLGAPYPAEAIDKAWRQLFFGSHHDGITGVTSDQVYLDLSGGWREAHDLGVQAREAALTALARHVDTSGEGRPLLVVNTQSWQRTDVTSVTVDFPDGGPAGLEIRDDEGGRVPAVVGDVVRRPDGSLVTATLTFVAQDIPSLGYRVYRVVDRADHTDAGWRKVAGTRVENEAFAVEADQRRGGALSRIFDKRSGRELLRPGTVAGEYVLDEEYTDHPAFGKGPWHIVPTGARRHGSDTPAPVHAEESPIGRRIVTASRLGDLHLTTEVTLFHGVDRVDFRVLVDGSIGRDQLLRTRFPLDIPGARPVYEVGNAVVGRTFGNTTEDVAEYPYALDNPAYTWAGLSHTARIRLHEDGRAVTCHAIGVAEVVTVPDGDADRAAAVRGLVGALVQQGVTATTSHPDGARHGTLALDSNLPDARVSIGGPDENTFTARVLADADAWYTDRLHALLEEHGRACLWVPADKTRAQAWAPGTDLRGERDLPVLVVAAHDAAALARAVADLTADLADATIDIDQPADPHGPPAGEELDDYSAAVLHRGTPGMVVEPDGTLYLSLMRSSTGWPAGTWIDGPKRTAPDGSSFAQQHWSHTFHFALAAGAGDWRTAGFVRAGQGYNSTLLTHLADSHEGALPAAASLLRAEPDNVIVTAVKPRGNPLAEARPAELDGHLTVRCYEAHGRATRARLSAFVPLRDGMQTDILERERMPLDTSDGTLRLDLGPAATVTATAAPVPLPSPSTTPRSEAAEAEYARYWLHNKGAAPVGHQSAQIFVEPRTLSLTQPTPVTVTVSAVRRASGRIELSAPPGVRVHAPDTAFELEDGHRRFDVLLEPEATAQPGIGHFTARIADEDGRRTEDVAVVRLGGDTTPTPLVVTLDTGAVTVQPGDTQEIRVRLANKGLDDIRGEAQLITPYGMWEFAGPGTQRFTVAPGADMVLSCPVRVPAKADPASSWALIKVMAFGEVHYTPAVPLTIGLPAQASTGRTSAVPAGDTAAVPR